MSRLFTYVIFCIILTNNILFSQEITLFQQFNGQYDYLAFGNTLNSGENNIDRDFCDVLSESQADLLMPPNTTIVAAYLYWAGSGNGDFEVALNNNPISADNTYLVEYNDPTYGLLTYFSCYTDVTDFITTTGNATYNFSGLDISETLANNLEIGRAHV